MAAEKSWPASNSPVGTELRGTLSLVVLVFLCGWLPPVASGQIPLNERVLVVYNSNAPESLAVAKYYMTQRSIPQGHLCRISVHEDDTISLDEFESRVRQPVRKCLEALGQRKILYIVLSYRTPYVVTIRDQIDSLDQFIADIWNEYSPSRAGNEVGPHPYYGGAQSQGNAYAPFVPLAVYREQPHALNIYSVWRLDAASDRLAKGLVDKALIAEKQGLSGKACFDLQFGGVDALPDVDSASGDWDLHQAAGFARRAGFQVTEDDQKAEFGTAPAPLRCDAAALYAGWYSLNHYNDAFTWNPGAIGLHLDSASAMNPRGGANWSANAVIKGITVTSGAVAEPYLTGLPHPDQFFLYLFQGANVGDAMLRSTEWLRWKIVNIGDPLYRPFPHALAPFNAAEHHETFLALSPPAITGGNSLSGFIGLSSPAPESGASVSLKSDHPDIVGLPSSVTIAPNAYTAKFSIATHTVNSRTTVRISMAASEEGRSNTLVLYPASH